MGGHMLPGPERRRAARHSMRYTLTAIMAIPLVAFAVVWALGGSVIVKSLGHGGQQSLHGTMLVRVTAAAAVGLVAILIATLLMAWFAHRVARDVSSLGEAARLFADRQLPELIGRLRAGQELDPARDLPPPASSKISEIGRVATVLAGVQRTTMAATASEIGVRGGISRVFVSLARRNQSLLQRQLRMIDDLERKAADPGALADLFPLDHLTTRMRRHAEGLIILSGATTGRSWSTPVPVIDVVRGAIAEVEDYRRVHTGSVAEGMMAGSAVADMIHLLAELIENATLFSSSGTQVDVRAERVGNGFAFEIEDRGLGIKPDDLDAINEGLSSPADFDLADADQLGLFVVAKLADRHGVRVFLRPSPYGGTTAIVVAPRSLVMHETEMPAPARPEQPASGAGQPEDLQLTLTSRVPPARPADPARDQQAGTPPTATRPGPPWDQLAGSTPPGSAWDQQDGFPLPATRPGPPWDDPAAPATRSGPPWDQQDGSTPLATRPGPPWDDPADPSSLDTGPAASAASPAPRPPAAKGPMPSVPRRRASVPGRPDSVPMADTHQGLPRRVRQASLSPHLRGTSRTPGDADTRHDPEERSPEQARNLLASLQRGWERGRAEQVPFPEQDTGAAGSSEPGAADSSEH